MKKSPTFSLALLYLKSTFSLSLPALKDLKKPKVLAKTLGIALLALLLAGDIGMLFVMLNVSMYDGLSAVGLQSLMLLNSATMAAVLVFLLAFMMALSLFSMSGIESGFMVLPFTSRQLLAAKMSLVYVTTAAAGILIFLVTMIVYGIKEQPPFTFYLNGFVTALALPLLPMALSYLLLIPFTRMSTLFRSKNFLLYVGGFLGLILALGFNFYLQTAMANIGNPEAFVEFASPESMVSRIGRAWTPSWLAWKALTGAGKGTGTLAALGNLALGAAACVIVVALLGPSYVRSLQSFGESTSTRKRLPEAGKGSGSVFSMHSPLRSLVVRELRLMNREPMYLLNGPFVVILMPLILGLVFIVQKEALGEIMGSIGPLLAGPGAYLVPAAFGAFLGSSTSIACTAVSRDARCVSWMRALPVPPFSFFLAKLIHAEIFSVFGVAVGSAIGVLGLGAGLADTLIGALLALLFATAFNMGGLWLDTAMPRLSWDNPIAAMKQNPNAIIAILSAMGLIGGMAFLSFRIALPKYAYALVFGTVFSGCIALWVVLYPGFAKRKYGMLEG